MQFMGVAVQLRGFLIVLLCIGEHDGEIRLKILQGLILRSDPFLHQSEIDRVLNHLQGTAMSTDGPVDPLEGTVSAHAQGEFIPPRQPPAHALTR